MRSFALSIPFLSSLFTLAFIATFVVRSSSEFDAAPAAENVIVVKRQAPAPKSGGKSKNASGDYTSVRTDGGCKLYAKEVVFFRKQYSQDSPSKYITTEVKMKGTSLESIHDGTCGNFSGTIILNYATAGPFSSSDNKAKLDNLKLTFNITYLRTHAWWELRQVHVEANGDLIKESGGKFSETFDGQTMRTLAIGSNKKFCYACGKPPSLFYDMDGKRTTIYGLKFKDLQIQPFEYKKKPGNFTVDVDDCVAFFSIGIWMFLVVAGVLLLVVFSGIGMISSLKTMDRFDDPKGKPLVISAKE